MDDSILTFQLGLVGTKIRPENNASCIIFNTTQGSEHLLGMELLCNTDD